VFDEGFDQGDSLFVLGDYEVQLGIGVVVGF